MLVLTRKEGEEVIINGNIKVTILKIQGSKACSIGIEAPSDMRIYRAELAEEVKQEIKAETLGEPNPA